MAQQDLVVRAASTATVRRSRRSRRATWTAAMRWPTGSCAIRIGLRTPASRRSSAPGAIFRRSANPSASMRGFIGSSSTRATPRREATRRWNSARVRVLPLNDVDPDPASSVADRQLLEDAFGRLSPEHRAVVVLHHHLGYPLTEIAATLGVPVGTARSRLHYAVRQLRTVLDADTRPPRHRGATRMNRSDEPLFDPRIADWLEDDPYEAPQQALDVVLAAFPSITQRHAARVPWRFLDMSSPLKPRLRGGGDRRPRGRGPPARTIETGVQVAAPATASPPSGPSASPPRAPRPCRP